MTHPFALALLRWYAANGRDLPWRHTTDPYPIWLSEVILQQTRIEQGRDYWLRFIDRYPTVQSLAQASEDDVLRLWQGLGYYSRARNLHTAAKQIVAQGEFPTTLEGIKALKGVGDYTAAAIASFAFGVPAAVVDGNVYRVLSRHFGIATPINSTEGKKEFTALAQELLPSRQASAYNQAIMDFGALQCTPKSPSCSTCPIADTCQALHSHMVDTLPVKLKTLTVKTRHLQYIYIRVNGLTAIRRRPSGDIWQGLWEPLLIENEKLPQLGGTLIPLRKKVKHVLTHRVLYADFYLLDAQEKPTLPSEFVWVRESDLHRYALPRLVELLIHTLPNSPL